MAIVITAEASIAQYNRGPIPTAFSPPNSCLSTYTSAETLGGFYFGNGFSTAGQNLPWDSSCYPTATSTPAVTDADAPWNLYYYSPAVSCPLGWSTPPSGPIKETFGGVSGTYLALGSGTTAALCCPSGFSTQSYGHQCVSSFAIGQHAITYKALSTNVNGIWETPSTVNTAFRTVTGAGDWTILGNGIPIWYQATDQVSSTASTTSSITSSLSPPTSAISTPFPPTSSGLSAGAKAGIGGGVALVAIALAAIIGFILLKRRQRRHHVEIPREELETIEPKHELVSQNGELVHELYSEGAKPTVYELHDNR